MENSPLNLAHLEARRAQRLKKSGRLEEALKCHARAVELLNKASRLTSLNLVLASLDWQQSHHERENFLLQSRLVAHRKEKMSTREDTDQTAKLLSTRNLITAVFKNLAQSSEALASYLRDFPEAESEPRLTLVRDSHRAIEQHLKQLFPDIVPDSDGSSSDTTPVESQALPQLAPLEIPHFDFGALNDN